MKTIAIIPSGGKGLRMGFNIPKQYVKVHGKEIIASTLQVFQNSSKIDEIAVSAQEDYFELLNEIKSNYSITKLKYIVKGGETRQDSVYNALNKVEAGDNDLIAVHDAARPLLPIPLLDSAIDFARENNSVVVALQAKDTVIQGNNIVKDYLKRDEIYLAQTPQIFTYSILKTAFNKAYEENYQGTDESTLVKKAGFDVKIFPGSPINIKVTTKDDLKLYEILIKLHNDFQNNSA